MATSKRKPPAARAVQPKSADVCAFEERDAAAGAAQPKSDNVVAFEERDAAARAAQRRREDAHYVIRHAAIVRKLIAAGKRLEVLRTHGTPLLIAPLDALLCEWELLIGYGLTHLDALNSIAEMDLYASTVRLIAANPKPPYEPRPQGAPL